MLSPVEQAGVATQLEWLEKSYLGALKQLGVKRNTAVFRRFFCSDVVNQMPELKRYPFSDTRSTDCAVSVIGEPPALPAKVALWAHHVVEPGSTVSARKTGSTFSRKIGDLLHHWTAGVVAPSVVDSHDQTLEIFRSYNGFLHANGLELAENVIRTWFFVQNVDANYHGMVTARNEVFATKGLTPDTHFIASTGIEGLASDVAAKVAMDAYAISDVSQNQIDFICAPENLCPTHLYGVAFERATAVSYQDRKQVFISGTASIDHEGEIVHKGDVMRQLDRTLVNISALLGKAGASIDDCTMMIVYLRDGSDQEAVSVALDERCPATPLVVTTAPVCRPGWLIEIECIATVAATNPELPRF